MKNEVRGYVIPANMAAVTPPAFLQTLQENCQGKLQIIFSRRDEIIIVPEKDFLAEFLKMYEPFMEAIGIFGRTIDLTRTLTLPEEVVIAKFGKNWRERLTSIAA